MSHKLLLGNLHNKPEYIEEVVRLLGELSEAWESIGRPASPDPLAPLATLPR